MTLDGILVIDKPQGWTSHDVVAKVRRLAGQRQVGHAGTLDPLATGVLVLVLGRATKLSSYLMATKKVYRAEVVLGATTLTDDAEAPAERICDASDVTREAVETVLGEFIGEIDQVPPRYAAVRQGGKKMYALARKGVEIEAPPRRVTIYRIEIEAWKPPAVRLIIECAAGTYIRSLARDLGEVLRVGGYLHALRRLRSGSFSIADAISLDCLLRDHAVPVGAIYPPERAVIHWPAAVVGADNAARLLDGQRISLGRPESGNLRLYGPTGVFLALGRAEGDVVHPFFVMRPSP